jgi:peroxiredoxin
LSGLPRARAWLAATALAACASRPPPPSAESPLVNGIVPSFSAQTTSGRRFETGEFYGRPFVVSIVGSECRPCNQTLRAAQAAYADMHDVSMVAVFGGSPAEANGIANDLGLKFPIVADEDGGIARRFEVREVPRTFVADAQGRVAWVGGADMTEEALVSVLDGLR